MLPAVHSYAERQPGDRPPRLAHPAPRKKRARAQCNMNLVPFSDTSHCALSGSGGPC